MPMRIAIALDYRTPGDAAAPQRNQTVIPAKAGFSLRFLFGSA